jgi:hypothetical protein
MSSFFRRLSQRQAHIGYFAICLILLALAVAFARQSGWPAALGVWVICIVILEMIYRWVVALRTRNRKKWWAQPLSRKYGLFLRLIVYGAAAVTGVITRHPALGYMLLALLAGGLVCAGIIRWLALKESQS